jgi:hemolysin D
MYEKHAVSEMDYMSILQQKIEMENNLNSEKTRFRSAQAGLNQAKEAKTKTISEARVTYAKEKADVAAQIESIRQELSKARTKNGLQTLTSPIDGVVQALTVFTVGGVVTEAEKIMQIVPTSGGLEIEAYISNKDIGFVHKNQDVVIKLDAFNFTKYGTIDGIVADISNDAFQDEKLGLIFKCRIAMKSEQMAIDGKTINLGAGMSVAAEIVTGDRRIIEFISSPAKKIINESFKER